MRARSLVVAGTLISACAAFAAEPMAPNDIQAYLDRFWNELSANPKSINEATRRHYAKLYGRPGAMHSAFNQFAAFTLDAVDNKAFAASGKLNMPVLALGGDHSFGTQMADIMRLVATDVTGGVITDSGHWVMEEQSKQTTIAIMNFLDQL
jgi:pimeloyl-ACP methyl ester carboxylesterase